MTSAHDLVEARSNRSKLDEDGNPIYLPNGKVAKGPNFFPPDLASIIERAQNATQTDSSSR